MISSKTRYWFGSAQKCRSNQQGSMFRPLIKKPVLAAIYVNFSVNLMIKIGKNKEKQETTNLRYCSQFNQL
ncbi:hypothetical protein KD4_26390 [Yersinia pseudotuberculosis]|nr:hypothetical protein YPSE1_41460 [Yersinia pseudotuberculosis]